jgi:Secretion system C-terminal sorting domain
VLLITGDNLLLMNLIAEFYLFLKKNIMKKIILITFLLSFVSELNAQSIKYGWHKTISSDTIGSSEANGICSQGQSTYGIGTVKKNIFMAVNYSKNLFFKTNNNSNDIFITKQTNEVNWTRVIGGSDDETGNDISSDLLGNLYCIGTFKGTVDFDPGNGISMQTAIGASDIFVLKLDTLGDLIWVKTFGGLGVETPNKVRVNKNGEIIIAGSFAGIVDFDPSISVLNYTSNGDKDMFVMSLSNIGTLNWAKQIGGTGNDEIQSLSLKNNLVYCSGYFEGNVDFDAGIGTFSDTALGGIDAFALVMDSAGNFVHQFSISGTSDESASGITVDSLNNIIVVGNFKNTIDVNPGVGILNLISLGGNDMFVAKYNNMGVLNFGFAVSNVSEITAKDVLINAGNKIVVCGSYQGYTDFNPGSSVNYLNKTGGFTASYTSAGIYDWSVPSYNNLLNSSFIQFSSLNAICRIGNNIYTAGSLHLDTIGQMAYLIGYINVGNAVTPIGFASAAPFEVAQFVGADNNSNVYSGGRFSYTTDLDPSNNNDLKTSSTTVNSFIQKLDANGNYLYGKSFRNAIFDDMYVDAIGNQYVVGRYVDSVNLDPSTTTPSFVTLNNKTNGFFAKYNSSGNLVFAKNLECYGINSNFLFFKIVLDSDNNIFICGQNAILDFDASINIDTNLVTTNSFGMLLKYDSLGNFIWVKPTGGLPLGIKIDYNNNILIYGSSYSFGVVIDYDPSSSIFNLPSSQSAYGKVYISKWSNNGQFNFTKGWENYFTTNSFIDLSSISVDSLNNIFILLNGNIIIDIDPGVNFITGETAQYVIKLDSNGNYNWHKSFKPDEGSGSVNCTNCFPNRNIAIDKKWNILFTRKFDFTFKDYDPSPNNTFYAKSNNFLGFVYLDSAGIFLTAKTLDGFDGRMGINNIIITKNNEVYACGAFTDSVDFSLQLGSASSTSKYNYDAFVLKLNTCDNVTSSTIIKNNCGPTTINGIQINTSGNYSFLYQNANNCDSIVIHQITIYNIPVQKYLTITNCGPYLFNGVNYNSSGNYIDTMITALGCDSIININLTVNPINTNILSLSDCGPINFNNKTYNVAGIFYDSLINSFGCDSIVQLNIIVGYPNANFTINGNKLSATSLSGTYQWVKCPLFTNIPGATDSIFTTTQGGNYALIQGNGNCFDTSTCITFIPLSLSTNSKIETISVTPNPASQTITLTKLIDTEPMVIYNLTGIKMNVDVLKKYQNTVVIDVSNYKNGIYIVAVNKKRIKFEVRH